MKGETSALAIGYSYPPRVIGGLQKVCPGIGKETKTFQKKPMLLLMDARAQ